MNKKLIRLTESDLHRIVKESVNRILREGRGQLGGLVNTATEKFNEFYMAHKDACISHINAVKEGGEFNDLENRLAWDFARATRYQDWMPRDEQGYPVGNVLKNQHCLNKHYATLLLNIKQQSTQL